MDDKGRTSSSAREMGGLFPAVVSKTGCMYKNESMLNYAKLLIYPLRVNFEGYHLNKKQIRGWIISLEIFENKD